MDIFFIIIGALLLAIGFALDKQPLKAFAAIFLIIGGLMFVVSFFSGYNSAVEKQHQYRTK